jgi:serine/threonine protein kinase
MLYEMVTGAYRARDTRLDRIVAVKIIREAAIATADARRLFEREARAISFVSHPNICTLYDVGNHEGTDFLVAGRDAGGTALATENSNSVVTARRPRQR